MTTRLLKPNLPYCAIVILDSLCDTSQLVFLDQALLEIYAQDTFSNSPANDTHRIRVEEMAIVTNTATVIATVNGTVTATEIETAIEIATAADAQGLRVDNVTLDVTTMVIPTPPAETIESENAKIDIGIGEEEEEEEEVNESGTETEETVNDVMRAVTTTDHHDENAISSMMIDVPIDETGMDLVVVVVLQCKEERKAHLHHQKRESLLQTLQTWCLSWSANEDSHNGTLSHPATNTSAQNRQKCLACFHFRELHASNLSTLADCKL